MAVKNMVAEDIVQAYRLKHPKSAALHEKAIKSFSGAGATHSSRILEPFRPYVTHALGSKKWDVDGNEYIDYTLGHGGLILGHSHPAIVQAAQEQIAKGMHYGENHELEVEWADLIKQMVPSAERVEYCACGQEANLMALRLARTFTKRPKILRFLENFHGWASEVAPEGSAGVDHDKVTVIPMNDANILEKELATKQYAICMTEGGGAHMAGQVPWDAGFMDTVGALTKKYGTIWLMDEVVTGFRDARGGYQEIVNVKPDLSALGKCTGGGLPVGVVIGRADIFEAFDPKRPNTEAVRHSGTWNGNPVLCATGVAACKMYLDGSPQKKANEMSVYLREKGNAILKQKKISGMLYGRTISHLYLGPIEINPADPSRPPTKDIKKILDSRSAAIRNRLCLHLLQRGVATMGGRMFIMSAVHTRSDIDKTMNAFADSLDAIVAEGVLSRS